MPDAPSPCPVEELTNISFQASPEQLAYMDELADEQFRATPGMRKPNRSAAIRWLIDYARANKLLLTEPSRRPRRATGSGA